MKVVVVQIVEGEKYYQVARPMEEVDVDISSMWKVCLEGWNKQNVAA